MTAAVVRHVEVVRVVALALADVANLQLPDGGRGRRKFVPDRVAETIRVTEGPGGQRVGYDVEVTGFYADGTTLDGRGTWRHGAMQRLRAVVIPDPIAQELLGQPALLAAEATS